MTTTGITINGESVKEWLEKKEQKEQNDLSLIREISTKHFPYKVPFRKKYKVRNGRSGKVRKLTRNEIIKEYGMEKAPKTIAQRIIDAMMNNMIPDENYTAAIIYEWIHPKITNKSFSASFSYIGEALVNAGYLARTGVPYVYEFTELYYDSKPSGEDLRAIAKEYVNKKNRTTRQNKKKTEQTVPNNEVQTEAKQSVDELIREAIEEHEQKPVQFSAKDIQNSWAIPENVKISVDINIRFGFLK